MKSIIAFALFVAVAAAIPVEPKNAVITKYSADNIGTGPFNYGFSSDDGTSVQAEGTLKNVGTENEASEIRGSYTYVAADGLTYTVTYVANENGYQPSGAHLPTVA